LEYVGLFVGSWAWGQDALFLQNQPSATDVVMGTNGLSNLSTGNSTVYMDRAAEEPVTQGTSEGGIIRAKYRATNASVFITN